MFASRYGHEELKRMWNQEILKYHYPQVIKQAGNSFAISNRRKCHLHILHFLQQHVSFPKCNFLVFETTSEKKIQQTWKQKMHWKWTNRHRASFLKRYQSCESISVSAFFSKPQSMPRSKSVPEIWVKAMCLFVSLANPNDPILCIWATKKPSYFPLYWLVHKDPYIFLLKSPYNWIV